MSCSLPDMHNNSRNCAETRIRCQVTWEDVSVKDKTFNVVYFVQSRPNCGTASPFSPKFKTAEQCPAALFQLTHLRIFGVNPIYKKIIKSTNEWAMISPSWTQFKLLFQTARRQTFEFMITAGLEIRIQIVLLEMISFPVLCLKILKSPIISHGSSCTNTNNLVEANLCLL